MSSDRLSSTEIDVTTLLQLSVVRRYAHLSRMTAEQALPRVIGHLACQLPPTQRLIVDAELRLRLFHADPPPGIDLDQLYAPDLGQRRRYITERWRRLHEALGAADVPPAPTARTLRDSPERDAFTALAELLTAGSELDIASMAKQDAPDANLTSAHATVTVVGDAATDYINVVEKFPEPGTSIWGDLKRHPGGKGLNRAVALAKLGLDVQLIATIGADSDGEKILDYLHKEHVDTSLVKVMAGYPTPVATVVTLLSGESYSIAFRKDRLGLSGTDLDSAAVHQALRFSDAVLVTFEQPIDIVAQVLGVVHKLDPPPWLIVNASPPTILPGHLHEHLEAVDYFIGTADEVAATWPLSSPEESTDRLLRRGVGAVCTVDGSGCTIRTLTEEFRILHQNNSSDRAAGASPAFSAALVYRLTKNGRTAERADFTWATAAISARSSGPNIPASMPSLQGIDMVAGGGNLNKATAFHESS
ncbi:carbohydrate kinase family protein [Nocardia sp. IFM 10818]